MINWLKGIAILSAVLLFSLVGKSGAEASGLKYEEYAPVLVYNDIVKEPKSDRDVSLEAFKSQLDWLSSNGYKTLTMDEYIEAVTKGKFNDKDVLLTFDGTYESLNKYVAPELEARNMRGTAFIAANRIDGKDSAGKSYLTSSQAMELAAKKHVLSLGSNTYSYTDLTKLDKLKMAKELKYSKKAAEELAMDYCYAVAYPQGKYNGDVIEAAIATHFILGFCIKPTGDYGQDTRFSIPRIPVDKKLCSQDNRLFKEYIQKIQ